jgi:bifunctional UDP-N-acetylglucosamine pyrophosphorylase / glucosamine-1-phosphate N-acetyltransferase
MIRRVLIVPAAGSGSRLGASLPKLLVPVGGQPMLDRLRDLYASHVDAVVLVVSPAALPLVRTHVADWRLPVRLAVQPTPTGMLDAILLGTAAVPAAGPAVWITWCDQVGVHPDTIARLAAESDTAPAGAAVLPTLTRRDPYIHFERDDHGTFRAVRQRREGDEMPAEGESDMGLFALSPAAARRLPEYAAGVVPGTATGERNFLPFLPWLAAQGAEVRTVAARDDMEAVGVNTPEDLAAVERYLAGREGAGA